ncbi:tail fiber assembly protein [Aeromonas veronii]|uniref:tail fiber assembly protein n=1 Tax=Aeromonas veronii TaxID=654 RepID=UPI0021E99FC3|nr:tail fiber assembly protein [Aeromonas veronii]MCV3284575.1 tail fiber assembly protein [Aeromonas veronii]
MHYIFNQKGECIAATPYIPDHDDISSRHCISVECDEVFGPYEIELSKDGEIVRISDSDSDGGENTARKNEALLNKKLQEAMLAMAPLEDADKLGIISEREKAQLTAWQRYRVALYRLPQSEGWPTDVTWPDAPQ